MQLNWSASFLTSSTLHFDWTAPKNHRFLVIEAVRLQCLVWDRWLDHGICRESLRGWSNWKTDYRKLGHTFALGRQSGENMAWNSLNNWTILSEQSFHHIARKNIFWSVLESFESDDRESSYGWLKIQVGLDLEKIGKIAFLPARPRGVLSFCFSPPSGIVLPTLT